MIDTGDMGKAHIDWTFVRENGLRTYPLETPIPTRGFHGEENPENRITHIVPLILRIRNHEEKIWLYTTNIAAHNIILGWPWMKLHEIIPDYKAHGIRFTSKDCPENCLDSEDRTRNRFKFENLKPKSKIRTTTDTRIQPELELKNLKSENRKPEERSGPRIQLKLESKKPKPEAQKPDTRTKTAMSPHKACSEDPKSEPRTTGPTISPRKACSDASATSPELLARRQKPDTRRVTWKLDEPDLNFDRTETRKPKPDRKPDLKPIIRRHDYDWKNELDHAMKQAHEPYPEPNLEFQPKLECVNDEIICSWPEPELDLDVDIQMDICEIGPAPFMSLTKKSGHEIFAASMADIEKTLRPKKHTDPAKKVPEDYHDILDEFSRKKADTLAEHRPYDLKIELEPGKQPPFGPMYGMTLDELKCLRKYLDEHLAKGFIRASRSPVAAPVLFAKKPGGGLRFCVDYRALNAITVKNRYPIPLIQETLNRLSKAKYYTKLDIIAAFNRVRIAEGDEWLTAFRTRYGLFEYLVMPFGLANAPSTFQHYVNDALRPFLDVFCSAYIDDVLIYSDNLEDHKKHVRSVLLALREAGLQLDVDKCEFHKTEVLYLGLIISTEGIRMDPTKVGTIQNWETPKTVKDVQSFIGFANFYRRFIENFSKIVAPLTALTKKDVKFNFDHACQHAFEHLKERFISAPILRHFDPELPCVVESDSSDHVSAGVLSQYNKDGILRPVAYFSKRLNPAECNYEIYDKELLAIIRCFEQWRPELEGAAFPIRVLTDHKNLQYFTTTKLLSHRQARWSEYLSRFKFVIVYRPGNQGQKPDALTRRTQDAQALDKARDYRTQTLLRPDLFQPENQIQLKLDLKESETRNLNCCNRISEFQPKLDLQILKTDLMFMETDRTPEQIIEEEYLNDDFIQETMNLIRKGIRKSKKISLSECTIQNDRLYYQNRLVIPDHDELKLKLLQYVHDSPVGGHNGRAKTLELLQRQYYWPQMHETVRRYVASCHVCSRIKASREKYHGLLKPLPVPDRRWKHISVDFVTGLPDSRGRTNIMVVVCRLCKKAHFIGCKDIETLTVARLFMKHIWKHHGLPDSVISDRGSQFISAFWDELTRQLKIRSRLSTAYHPETDGQTERINAIMEQFIRAFTSYMQDDWLDWLPMAEFTYNNTTSETTKVSPFLADSGQHPRMGFEPPTDTPRPHYQALQAREANEFVKTMADLDEHLKSEMKWAQAVYESNANRNRTPAPAYQVGDYVYLDARNLKTRRPCKKLDWKNIGGLRVSEVISPYSYRLDLPETMKNYNVFHTSLLRPAPNPDLALPGQKEEQLPPVEVDGEDEYLIDRIETSRYNRRTRTYQYLVKWTSYQNPTWEPYEFVRQTTALTDYYNRYPNRPRPDDYDLDS
jgi:hypothetical protein